MTNVRLFYTHGVTDQLPKKDTPYKNNSSLCLRHFSRVPAEKVPTEAILLDQKGGIGLQNAFERGRAGVPGRPGALTNILDTPKDKATVQQTDLPGRENSFPTFASSFRKIPGVTTSNSG
ncbi:hypothetical protein Bbelb_395710 [Branchiostoma belcheri]|nr:hypothetical protein Bbelb_395710 [Branchiostoma belcheri]